MKVYEILQLNANLFRALARSGVAIEDVRYIDLWNDYERLRRDGLKVAYIVAHLCDVYQVSERTVYRVVRRFSRGVSLDC